MSSRLRLSCFSGVAYDAADAALRDAAAAGDADGVKAALARGADVDCRSADDPDTPLFLAVMLRTTEAAAALLKAGASVHARNSHGAHQPRSQRRSAMRRCQLGVWRRWGGGRVTATAALQRRSCPHPRAGGAGAPRRRAPGARSSPHARPRCGRLRIALSRVQLRCSDGNGSLVPRPGQTPLMLSVLRENAAPMVELLLKHNADPRARSTVDGARARGARVALFAIARRPAPAAACSPPLPR